MKKLPIILLLLIIYFPVLCAQDEPAQNQKEHQFDFWIGEWNVYKYGTDSIVGVSTIKPILDYKTIEENYQSLRYRYKGKSFNFYNPKTNEWEQFWVDNSGERLYLSGEYQENKMILSDCKNEATYNRIIWTDLKDGSVRQEWEQSENGGDTWKKIFDGHYRTRQ